MLQGDRHIPGTPSWLDLMTPDIEKARAFYGKLFGWEFHIGPPETGFYSIALKNGKSAAGMGQMPKDNPSPYPTAWTTYFESENLEATCERVKERGGAINMPPMDVMEEGRLAVCADNNGAVFGLWQPKNHKGAQFVEQPGGMAWHEVNVRDSAKARDFYAYVFGLEPKKLEGDMEYWTLEKGPTSCCGILQMDKNWPENVPAHWMNYFSVENTDEACKQITELGGKVCVPPFDTTYGRISVVEDPFGAVFSIAADPKK